jgi:hypothetical protein
MTAKRLEIFVIVVIIAGIGIIYAFTQKPVLAPTVDTATSVMPTPNAAPPPVADTPTTTFEYQGVNGKNALELLKASHQVQAKHYSFGDLVTGIDGITPDASHFWAMYVNGQFAQVGASSLITKNSDTIKWEIDAVADTKK